MMRDDAVVAIKAHNLEVVSSNLTPATKKESRRVNYDPAMNLYKGIKEESICLLMEYYNFLIQLITKK